MMYSNGLYDTFTFTFNVIEYNLKAAGSATDPSSSLARNMLSPRLDGWLGGWLAGWDLVNLLDLT